MSEWESPFSTRLPSLVACHDKLQTAIRLATAGIAHPKTSYVDWVSSPSQIDAPVVVKPRFRSLGKDVFLCESRPELERCLRRLHRPVSSDGLRETTEEGRWCVAAECTGAQRA